MKEPDFVGGLCNSVLYQKTCQDEEKAYNNVVKLILENNYHEVALNYGNFLSILSFDQLTIEMINEILPSNLQMS